MGGKSARSLGPYLILAEPDSPSPPPRRVGVSNGIPPPLRTASSRRHLGCHGGGWGAERGGRRLVIAGTRPPGPAAPRREAVKPQSRHPRAANGRVRLSRLPLRAPSHRAGPEAAASRLPLSGSGEAPAAPNREGGAGPLQ